MTDKYEALRAEIDRGLVDDFQLKRATISALLAERDALREALTKTRGVIAADRQSLIDTHGINGQIPADDELGTLGLHDYDGALHVIDAALAQHQGERHVEGA